MSDWFFAEDGDWLSRGDVAWLQPHCEVPETENGEDLLPKPSQKLPNVPKTVKRSDLLVTFWQQTSMLFVSIDLH